MAKLKKIVDKKTQRVFAESEVLVVLERMEDNFKVLAEGQVNLKEEMHREMSNLENRMDGLESEMKAGFSMIMDYLKRIDDEIMEIKAEFKKLDEKKADKNDYSILERRLENAENEIKRLKLLLKKKKVKA